MYGACGGLVHMHLFLTFANSIHDVIGVLPRHDEGLPAALPVLACLPALLLADAVGTVQPHAALVDLGKGR